MCDLLVDDNMLINMKDNVDEENLIHLKITFYMIVRKHYEHIEVMFRILLQLCQHTDNKLNSR
jgi:hypothetical protein